MRHTIFFCIFLQKNWEKNLVKSNIPTVQETSKKNLRMIQFRIYLTKVQKKTFIRLQNAKEYVMHIYERRLRKRLINFQNQ